MAAFEFTAELWVWDARAADTWTFVSLPPGVADEVLDRVEGFTRGFGSVRVEVTVGGTTWRTSLFPSKEERTYVLPVKKAVRRAEDLAPGAAVHMRLRLLDVGD